MARNIKKILMEMRNSAVELGYFDDFISDYGFREFDSGAKCSANTFKTTFRDIKFVLKTRGTKILSIPPKDVIPTIDILFEADGKELLLQPYAKRGDNKALEYLNKRNPEWEDTDSCIENCGYWNGKPVIIDW